MAVRLLVGTFIGLVVVLGLGVSTASGVDVLVTGNANLSTLATADDTVLHWTGNYTVTVDGAYTGKTIAGLNAASFTGTIDFLNANTKVILGNSAGNVVIEANGGELKVQGAGTGARTAGFLVSPASAAETIEIRTTIDDAANANYWVIGGHTLLFSGTAPYVGILDIGLDGGTAVMDIDESGTVTFINPTGDFTIDVASGKVLAIQTAWTAGANTVTVSGASSTSSITNVAELTLDNVSSVLGVSGTITFDDLNLGADAAIALQDGALLTLTDAVPIGARTLTLRGTTGSAPDRITATGGFTLDNVNSVLKIEGDTADAMVVSRVDTGAELVVGKGIDANEDVQITALSALHAITLDVAPGKTLSGTTTLTVARVITLNNTGTVSAITAKTAAGTVQFTGAGTVTTLTNDIAGTTVDVDESATITTLALNQNATLDVLTAKTLTATATVAAGKILTVSGAGTVSKVVLNGTNAEVNMTGGGVLTTLDVDANGGILDVDTTDCTVTTCNMKADAGDLAIEHGSRKITSTGGFDVNNNTLSMAQGGGTIDLVTMDTFGGVLDVNEAATITALTVSASVEIKAASGRIVTTTATVNASGILKHSENGTLSTVVLNGAGAELNMAGSGQVTTLTVSSDGGVLNVDATSTVGTVAMTATKGNLTVDVATGKTLAATFDINDNRLTIIGTGIPGTITMDTDGGILDVNEDCSPNFAAFTGNATVDIAASKTLTGTLDIGATTLTLEGAGTVTRIDATTGTVLANGGTTIGDLRANFGSGGTFTYGGSAKSTVTSMANSGIGANERLVKTGTGSLTVGVGFGTLFGKATGVQVAVEQGELIVGSTTGSNDISLNDDADEITVASGATLTTYGSFSVTTAGTNVNVDAAVGSTVNLSSAGGTENITAAADNDYQLLGTVNITGAGASYTMNGAFVSQFGNLTIAGTASLINRVPASTMQFVPGSTVTLNGSGSDGAAFTVDGQAATTRIVMTTTAAGDPFTIDRNASTNLTMDNVALSNSSYRSNDGGAAIDELGLTGTADVDKNTNWFSAAFVADSDDTTTVDEDTSLVEDGAEDTSDVVDIVDDPTDEPTTTVGQLVSVGRDGSASAGAASSNTNVSGFVDVTGATSGSLFVVIADGNLRTDFAGIPDDSALPVTLRASSSVIGDGFVAVVQFCVTDAILSDSRSELSELVLYTYQEPDGPWVLAGEAGKYRGDMEPTVTVGDYGYESEFLCVWAVRDGLSDFAIGTGPTDSSAIGDEDETVTEQPDTPADAEPGTTAPPLCGLFGMVTACLMGVGLAGLRWLPRRGL